MIKERGIDPDRFIVFPVATVEEFKTQAIKIIDNTQSHSSYLRSNNS